MSLAPPPPPAARYDIRGATLDAPRDWEEESVLAIVAPGPRPQPKVTLVQLRVSADTTLELFAARRIEALSTLVTGLNIAESKEVLLGGQRAVQLSLFWEELEGRMHQRLVFTRMQNAMFVLAMSCLEEQAARAQPVFESIAASFRLPTPTGSSRAR